jgi:hypothetical protein
MQAITAALIPDRRTRSDARLGNLAKEEIRRQTNELDEMAKELLGVRGRGRRAAMSVLRRHARKLEGMGARALALVPVA